MNLPTVLCPTCISRVQPEHERDDTATCPVCHAPLTPIDRRRQHTREPRQKHTTDRRRQGPA